MSKTPFVTVIGVSIAALIIAGVSRPFVHDVEGVQFVLMMSYVLALAYAVLRITYDLVPDRFIKGKRQGRS